MLSYDTYVTIQLNEFKERMEQEGPGINAGRITH